MQQQSIARMIDMWAIHPDWLGQHADFFQILPNGEASIRPDAILNMTVDDSPVELLVHNGVAFILIRGILFNGYASWPFATGYKWIQEQVIASVESPDVEALAMLSTSPGGMVAGAQETAMVIDAASRVKPVLTFGDGIMASAAYWLASASSLVVVTPTTLTGSTGVVVEHTDMSGMLEQVGVRRTEITSGELKRIASTYQPLTDAGRTYLQGLVSHLGNIFVSDVVGYRELTDTQSDQIAQAGDYIGEQAVSVGLIDDVGSVLDLDQYISLVRNATISVFDAPLEEQEPDRDRPEREAVMRLGQVVPGIGAGSMPGGQANDGGQQVSQPTPVGASQSTPDTAETERLRIATILGNAPAGCEAEAQDMAFINPCSVEQANARFLQILKEKPAIAPAQQAVAPSSAPQAAQAVQQEPPASQAAQAVQQEPPAPQAAQAVQQEPGPEQGQEPQERVSSGQFYGAGLSLGLQRFLGEGLKPASGSADTSQQQRDPILQAMLDSAARANQAMQQARNNSITGDRRTVRTQAVSHDMERAGQ